MEGYPLQRERHPVFVMVIMILMVYFSMLLIIPDIGASVINAALAFGFSFTFLYGKKLLGWIAFAVFAAQFALNVFIVGLLAGEALVLAFFMTLVLVSQIELMRRFVRKGALDSLLVKINVSKLMVFLGSLVFIAMFGAYFSALVTMLAGELGGRFIDYFWVYAFGDFMGFLIFVPVSVLAIRFDKPFMRSLSFNRTLALILIYGVYALLVFLLVYEIGFIDFDRYLYFLVIFYLTAAFVFSHRILHFLTFLLLSACALIYMPTLEDGAWVIYMCVTTVSFVAIATILTIILKRFVDIRYQQARDIDEKNKQSDRLLDEVYGLLKFSASLIDKREQASEQHAKEVFRIAYTLFADIDAGYCYFETLGSISMLDVSEYDEMAIPYLHESQDMLETRSNNLMIIQHLPKTLKELYGLQYGLFDLSEKQVESRAVMVFYFDEDKNLVIVLDKFKKNAVFTKSEEANMRRFASLADRLFKRNYFAIKNLMLKDDIVLSLVRTLELYDPYTRGHSEDVAFLAVEIAKHMNMDQKLIDLLYWGGILHDIGKVGVPSKIIRKAGKLTKDEYARVQQHVHHGADIILDSKSLQPVMTMIKHHHEWWDGGGYPDGLKGEAIPLGAQVIAVADMIATMATDRPYRSKQSIDTILAELKQYRGSQFPPKMTDVVIRLIEGGLLKKLYPNLT